MLKIFSTNQIKALDAYTIKHESIASIDLMERACVAFTEWINEKYNASHKIGIVCGTGNNGGDGLGIARLLNEWKYPVKVWIVRGSAKESEDFKINLGRLKGKVEIYEITSSSDRELFSGQDILIDAVFGSGLSRSVEGIYEQVIQCINQTNAIRIAVDIPSGLLTDQHSSGEIVKADFTVSFQLPKLAFLLPENQPNVGEWNLVDIGLNEAFIRDETTDYYFLTKDAVKKIVKPRAKFAHKGNHGRALIIAGSYGKMGACILAARSALRSGLGLLTVHVPKSGNAIVQTAVPEAMTSIDNAENFFTICPSTESYQSIGIGPGLGQEKETAAALRKVFESGKPLVIDADALNIISTHNELIQLIPKGSILTPHPKEFERLVGTWKNDFHRLEKQIQFAIETKSVIVLKGANTSIATADGKVFFNSTGNPGMATGGSGDVLTGILTGLLAQRYSADEAAILGVYLHGLSGDLAAEEKSMYSMIASDLIDFLSAAYRSLLH